MAADYPPFMNAYGNVSKILERIKEAQTPARFNTEFLEGTLNFPGGSRRPFLPLAKRIGFVNSDGTPTEIYRRFQNPDRSKGAMAEAIRKGYPSLFERNQNAGKIDSKSLEGLIREATGLDADSKTLKAIVGTFNALKAFADFDAPTDASRNGDKPKVELPAKDANGSGVRDDQLRFSYTIYLDLPNTSDINVFNSIFKSLRENILTK